MTIAAVADYTAKLGSAAGTESALSHESCGGAYRAMGEIAKALEDYSTAIEIDPSRAGPFGNRYRLYEELWQSRTWRCSTI